MAERRDAHVLEVVGGQPGQKLGVDVVGAEEVGVLAEADPAEPAVDVQRRLLLSSAETSVGLARPADPARACRATLLHIMPCGPIGGPHRTVPFGSSGHVDHAVGVLRLRRGDRALVDRAPDVDAAAVPGVDVEPLQPEDLAAPQPGVDGHADDRVIGRGRRRRGQQFGDLDRLEVRPLLRPRQMGSAPELRRGTAIGFGNPMSLEIEVAKPATR
jgi:hypothetical protein